MSYRLKVKEPLAEGIRRIAFEQIEIVVAELRANADANAAIHNARRALKRLRALLRLVRTGLDEATYRRESQRLAEAGRSLAGARDRHVLRQTFGKLAKTASPPLPEDFVTTLEAMLAEGATAKKDPADPRKQAATRLAASRKFFAGAAIDGLEKRHAFEGLEKVYRKARKLHRECQHGASDEQFHGLRKCVQQHWRHMQLLSRAWPDALMARASEAKTLSQLLGDDHDLSVLIGFLSANEETLPAEGGRQLRDLARAAQTALREEAHLHSARLFSERPEEVTERLKTYWDIAYRLAEVAPRAEVESASAVQPEVKGARAQRAVRRTVSGARKSQVRRKSAPV